MTALWVRGSFVAIPLASRSVPMTSTLAFVRAGSSWSAIFKGEISSAVACRTSRPGSAGLIRPFPAAPLVSERVLIYLSAWPSRELAFHYAIKSTFSLPAADFFCSAPSPAGFSVLPRSSLEPVLGLAWPKGLALFAAADSWDCDGGEEALLT